MRMVERNIFHESISWISYVACVFYSFRRVGLKFDLKFSLFLYLFCGGGGEGGGGH